MDSVVVPVRDLFELRILGPIQFLQDGREVLLPGRMLRALVAALVVRAPTVSTADQLIDDLWADCAPRTARASLHNLLSTLRRALGHQLIQTVRNGYVLAVGEDQVDAIRFERLLARSRQERLLDKVRLLEHGLSLWRGSPLFDVRYEEFAQSEIRRLEELHVWALEEILVAKVELGASDAVVPELQRLVDAFPFRERLRMQLMVALHRSGRSVEALASYESWRQLLVGSWGMEPGRAIQRLCDDIRVGAHSLE